MGSPDSDPDIEATQPGLSVPTLSASNYQLRPRKPQPESVTSNYDLRSKKAASAPELKKPAKQEIHLRQDYWILVT